MSQKNPYKKGGMFEGASFLLIEKAKQLRNKMTATEEVLNKISEIVNNIIKNNTPKTGV